MTLQPILAPVVALVAWTLVVMLWMLVTRCASSAGWASPSAIFRPVRAASTWRARPPDQAQWKSHNYNHLMEQPTIFYAIASRWR